MPIDGSENRSPTGSFSEVEDSFSAMLVALVSGGVLFHSSCIIAQVFYKVKSKMFFSTFL
jgi:hypothetical protein